MTRKPETGVQYIEKTFESITSTGKSTMIGCIATTVSVLDCYQARAGQPITTDKQYFCIHEFTLKAGVNMARTKNMSRFACQENCGSPVPECKLDRKTILLLLPFICA